MTQVHWGSLFLASRNNSATTHINKIHLDQTKANEHIFIQRRRTKSNLHLLTLKMAKFALAALVLLATGKLRNECVDDSQYIMREDVNLQKSRDEYVLIDVHFLLQALHQPLPEPQSNPPLLASPRHPHPSICRLSRQLRPVKSWILEETPLSR